MCNTIIWLLDHAVATLSDNSRQYITIGTKLFLAWIENSQQGQSKSNKENDCEKAIKQICRGPTCGHI
jgi:hypothetical protein